MFLDTYLAKLIEVMYPDVTEKTAAPKSAECPVLETPKEEKIVGPVIEDKWAEQYKELVRKEITICEGRFGVKIPEHVVFGIIKAESNGSMWACRYEPGFFRWLTGRLGSSKVRERPGVVSRDTEMRMRATSFGVMQVMGQVAREEGFSGDFLTELCDPALGIRFGVQHFARKLKKYKELDAAIAAYNAGSPRKTSSGAYANQAYVDKVKTYSLMFEEWCQAG